MAKKLHLESEYDTDNTLIGIVSHQRDYRLIWSINEKLKICLVRMDNVEIYQDKTNELNAFSFYYFEEPETTRTYFIISNRGEKGFLFPTFKQTDYFLLIKGNFSEMQKQEIEENLSSNEYILKVHSVELFSINNIENFLSDVELSMLKMQKKK